MHLPAPPRAARWCGVAAAAAAGLLVLTACTPPWSSSPVALPPPRAVPDTGAGYTFDGWGVSLAWWAEIAGAWGQADDTALVNALFGDPAKSVSPGGYFPLGLNVVRYNIGASPVNASGQVSLSGLPGNCQNFGPGKAVPAPQQGPNEPVNLGYDASQVAILEDAIGEITGTGALPGASSLERPVLEAFANSPPWWMLKDKCPAGIKGTNALSPSEYASYAHYLVNVLGAFRPNVTFGTIDPFNEPYEDGGWWGQNRGTSNSLQEGANFTPAAQAQIVSALCAALSSSGLSTKVSAPDGNTPDSTRTDLAQIMSVPRRQRSCLSQVNTHSYSGTKPYTGDGRPALRAAVAADGIPSLSVSEFGTGDTSGIVLAKQIADDLQGLRPRTWVYWTAMERPGGWGLIADPNMAPIGAPSTAELTKRFFAYQQYTRFIRPGATIYPMRSTPSPSSQALRLVVARDHGHAGQTVVVATNPGSSPRSLAVDLSALHTGGSGRVVPYTTNAAHSDAPQPGAAASLGNGTLRGTVPPDTVATYVIPSSPGPRGTSAGPTASISGTWQESDGQGDNKLLVWPDGKATILGVVGNTGACAVQITPPAFPSPAAGTLTYQAAISCDSYGLGNVTLPLRSSDGGHTLTLVGGNGNGSNETLTRIGPALPGPVPAAFQSPSAFAPLAGVWKESDGAGNDTFTISRTGAVYTTSGTSHCRGSMQQLTGGSYRINANCGLGEGWLPVQLSNDGQTMTLVYGASVDSNEVLTKSG